VIRWFKGDKWNRFYGFVIPFGAMVKVIRFYTHRRVKVEYEGEIYMTMLWCLSKTEVIHG
jgi:hypothetical protein